MIPFIAILLLFIFAWAAFGPLLNLSLTNYGAKKFNRKQKIVVNLLSGPLYWLALIGKVVLTKINGLIDSLGDERKER
jgi:hypothetical protein